MNLPSNIPHNLSHAGGGQGQERRFWDGWGGVCGRIHQCTVLSSMQPGVIYNVMSIVVKMMGIGYHDGISYMMHCLINIPRAVGIERIVY